MKLSSILQDSITLKFSELAREKSHKGEKIISLGLGEPVFETPQPIIDETVRALNNGYTRYSNFKGLYELRKLIVDKLTIEYDIVTKPENVIVTPGAKQAIMLTLMAILEPGDEVINFNPCYISYIPQIKIAEPTSIIHNVDLHKEDFSIDWDKIESLMRRNIKAIILNSPHNPTGQILTKDDAERFVEIVKKYDIYIISDEVYDALTYSNMILYSLGSNSEIKDKVIIINGFSKTFSMTGWRIGYLVSSNDHIIKNIVYLQQHLNHHTCTFIQKGACAAFGLSSDYLNSYKMDLKERASFLCENVASNEKLRIVPPQGGMFAFLDISSSGKRSDDFAYNLLLKKNVAVSPGIVCGKNWDDHVRISLCAASKEEFEEGVILINQFVKDI